MSASNEIENPTQGASTTSGNDSASQLLDNIFGDNWENLINLAQNGSSLTGPSSVLGSMFEVFNAAVLAATAIIVFYTVATGVAQTAHEGQLFGKRYSSLWMPIRSAMGAAMIAPVVGGFSLIQAIILMMAGLSISFANMTTTKLIDWMAAGKPVVQVGTSSRMNGTSDIVGAILNSEMCQAYYLKTHPDTTASSTFDKTVFGTPFLEYKNGALLHFIGGSFSDHCGKITLSCDDTGADCNRIKEGVEKIRTILGPVVSNIVDDQANIDNTVMQQAITSWKATETEVQNAASTKINAEYATKLKAFKDQSTAEGWIKLGQWYWAISSINAKYYGLASINYEYETPTTSMLDPDADEMAGYNEYVQRVYRYLSTNGGTVSADSAAINASLNGTMNGRGVFGFGADGSSQSQANIVNYLFNMMMVTDGDPLQRMMNIGHVIIQGTVVVAGGAWLLGNTPLGKGVSAALKEKGGEDGKPGVMSSILGMVLLFLFITALALAFYLPSIPFIVWTMAVMGWLVMLMQSLLAGPIWAAGHVLPEGEGLAGNHAKQGYMLFLNVMIRPVLLTIGLIMSFLVMWGGAWLVMSGLQVFASGMINSTDTGPLSYIGGNIISAFIGMFAILLIGTGLMIAIVHRSFDVIYEAADEVLAWIGGGKQLGGEGQNVSKVQGIVAGNFGKLEGKAMHMRGVGKQVDTEIGGKKGGKGVDDAAGKDKGAVADHLPGNASEQLTSKQTTTEADKSAAGADQAAAGAGQAAAGADHTAGETGLRETPQSSRGPDSPRDV